MIARLTKADRALLGILAFAAALRIAIACWPVIHHADELWQYLESARHVLGERWVRTWEADAGARSWLVPVLLAGPMALGQAIGPGSGLDVLLARLLCVGIALLGVLGAAGLGWRISRMHGLIAAFVASIWYELVYFGPRTLSEPIAVALMLFAAWLLTEPGDRRRLAAAGLLLGLGVLVRFQYAPAAAVLALWAVRSDARRWGWMAVGGLGAVAISGLAEVAMGAPPLLWMWRSVHANLVENRSAAFGVAPVWDYGVTLWKLWGPALFLIGWLAVLGARRYPALMAVALVNLAVHSLIPHKEYRFILLTTAMLVVLAAIGSADLLARRKRPAGTTIWLCLGWALVSGACAGLGESARHWGNSRRLIRAWQIAGEQPQLCGVAMYRIRHTLAASQTLLEHDVPIYQYDDAGAPAALQSRAFNVVITPRARGTELPGYRAAGCGGKLGDYCVFRREGPCVAAPEDAPNAIEPFLRRNDAAERARREPSSMPER